MNTRWLAIVFLIAYGIGQVLALFIGDSKETMQGYAIFLSLISLVPIVYRAVKQPAKLLSAHTVVIAAPIWFLYLEAALPNGDAWLLPANSVVKALSYVAFFLAIFNIAYVFQMPKWAIRFHERNFRVQLPVNFFPWIGISFTLVMLFVIWGYYEFDAGRAADAYLAGRATGSGGLIKRGGLGSWEVFLQPLGFMAPVVPTLAALSWVRFGKEKSVALPLKLFVSACAAFLIFIMFLGGSRGNMAVFLVGPAAIWFIFGRKLSKPMFWGVTIVMFLFLIGMWEYQMRKRVNLLENVSSFEDIVEETSFNPLDTHRDNNLYIFTLNVMYMSDPYPFKGYGELYYILVNPIPRAIWAGKPKGIQESKYTFQTARGPVTRGPIKMGTASLSSSIVSDGYIMHHYFGIAVYALIFAYLASVWDFVGQRRLFASKLYFILNAAWLFWLLWSFRAAFAWITGMYSVWGAYVFCYATSKIAGGLGVRKSVSLSDNERQKHSAAKLRYLQMTRKMDRPSR